MTLRKILEEYERIVEIRHHCRIRIQMFGHQGEFKESKAMIVKCNEIIAEAREAIVSGDGRHIANMIFKMDEIE